MPRRELKFELDRRCGDIKGAFIDLYGGNAGTWDWLKGKLDHADPAQLMSRCEELEGVHLLTLPPCLVFGRLALRNREAWWKGLEVAFFWVEAVVHQDYGRAYYATRADRVPYEDQQDE